MSGYVLLAVLLAACGGEPAGRPAIHDRINAMSDCAALQQEFDIAMGNVERYEPGDDRRDAPLAYAKTAADRMVEVGC